MAHKDEGNYGGKHDGEVEIRPEIAEPIWRAGRDSRLDCAGAHKIAEELEVSPAEVGETLDLMEWKITRCQLGLFGYGQPSKLIKAAESVTEEQKQVLSRRSRKNAITCLDLWEAAEELKLGRLETACLCEALGLKIHDCQLGSF